MKKIVVAIPHSHTWFWTSTCVSCLQKFPPQAKGYEVEVVVVDNSPWSPAIKGITEVGPTLWGWSNENVAKFRTIPNHKSSKFHATGLDCVADKFDFDLFMALETDVLVLRPDWLQWFVDQLRIIDYAAGAWHHEQFVNPSCTLYRGTALREMLKWCKNSAPNELRWGPNFSKAEPIESEQRSWIAGAFAEKRGWPEGTILQEQPTGQLKGVGWYEPGQQLHHWAVNAGYTYRVLPTSTVYRCEGLPIQTLYGSVDPLISSQLSPQELVESGAYSVHLWGGTRALDILKHDVSDPFVVNNTPYWLAREARFWKEIVPQSAQQQILDLIRKYGWHTTGANGAPTSERDNRAAEYVRNCYREGGVEW